MLGPTNMGKLSVIFGELVRMLKELPPGGFDKAYTHKPPTTAAPKPVSFMCDKKLFKEAVRLAEMGAQLAESAHNPGEIQQDPALETILAGMKSLEAKVDQLSLDTANLAAKQPEPTKTFAAATAGGKTADPQGGKPKSAAKGKKPPSAHPPPAIPKITLAQLSAERADFVETASDAGALASRAKRAITLALEEQSTKTGSRPPPLCTAWHHTQLVHR